MNNFDSFSSRRSSRVHHESQNQCRISISWSLKIVGLTFVQIFIMTGEFCWFFLTFPAKKLLFLYLSSPIIYEYIHNYRTKAFWWKQNIVIYLWHLSAKKNSIKPINSEFIVPEAIKMDGWNEFLNVSLKWRKTDAAHCY